MRSYNGVNITIIKDKTLATIIRQMDIFLRDIGPAIVQLTAASGAGVGGGAPTTASFVTVANEASLSAERRLAVNAPVTLGDAGPNTSITLGVTLVSPDITYGTTAAAGVANSLIRSDARIKFPTAIMSAANLSTLTLTDSGLDQTLTGNLGNIALNLPGALNINFGLLSTTANVVNISGKPDLGNFALLTASWSSPAALGPVTVRCWNANYSGFTGVFTGATIEGYGNQTFSLTPSAGSDTLNKAYAGHLLGPLINNANAGWTEIATLLLEGSRRSIANPTVTTCGTLILECPTIGATAQQGIIIRQRTAQQTATDRIGLDILTHNSGTNRWSLRAADRVEVQSQAAQATTALLLRQLATGATAGAHANLNDKAGDGTPVEGDLWRNADRVLFRQSASPTDMCATQPYALGSFTIPTGFFRVVSRKLALSGSQRATLAGTATLRIN